MIRWDWVLIVAGTMAGIGTTMLYRIADDVRRMRTIAEELLQRTRSRD